MFINTFEHFTAVKCGLVSFMSTTTTGKQDDDGDVPIAVSLESVDVQATLVHAAAEVTVTQAYVNNLDQSVDTYYYFPLHLEDTVTGFEVEIDGCTFKNIVLREEVRNNKNEYEEAVRRNPKRFWLNPKAPDDFYMTRVGFLKPETRAVVTISYVTEVKFVSQKIQFEIPNTVVPFFKVFQKLAWSEKEEDESDVDLVDISEPGATVKIFLEIFLEGEGSICSLASPSHVLQKATIGHIPDKENWSTGIVEFVGESLDMSRDFIITVGAANFLSPRLYLEESPDEIVLMSTFCPLLSVGDSPKCEIIFAIESLLTEEHNATETLELTLDVLLQSLPKTSTFNVIGRGTCLREFAFSTAASFGDENLNQAILATSASAHSLNIAQGVLDTASLLEKVFTQNALTDSYKQIILLLQKALKEEELDKLITLVKLHTQSQKSRLFVIAIGNKLSRRSIQKLANTGEGIAILIPNADPDWHATALTVLEYCSAPSFKDITLNWREFVERFQNLELEPSTKDTDGADPDLEIVDEVAGEGDKSPLMQIPEVPPPVFNGSQFVSFGIFIGKYFPRTLDIQGISYQNSNESLQYNYNIQLHESRERHMGSDDTITKLAYSKGLRQLEDAMRLFSYGSRKMRFAEEKTKERIMQIACRAGIASKYTAFSTINVETGEEVTGHWTKQTRYNSNVTSMTNSENKWSGGIAYGSIARKKLGFIRKLQATDSIKPKIPRTMVIGEVVDLTNEKDEEPMFSDNTELIILD